MDITKIEKLRTKFKKSLPKSQVCTHCQKRRPQDQFGVRLMNGPDVENKKAAPKFRTQPCCITCRS